MAKTVGVLRGSICFIAGKFHQTKLRIVLSACVRACAFVRVFRDVLQSIISVCCGIVLVHLVCC